MYADAADNGEIFYVCKATCKIEPDAFRALRGGGQERLAKAADIGRLPGAFNREFWGGAVG